MIVPLMFQSTFYLKCFQSVWKKKSIYLLQLKKLKPFPIRDSKQKILNQVRVHSQAKATVNNANWHETNWSVISELQRNSPIPKHDWRWRFSVFHLPGEREIADHPQDVLGFEFSRHVTTNQRPCMELCRPTSSA